MAKFSSEMTTSITPSRLLEKTSTHRCIRKRHGNDRCSSHTHSRIFLPARLGAFSLLYRGIGWHRKADSDHRRLGTDSCYPDGISLPPNFSEFPKISMIWKSVPSQIAREIKKFLYKIVKEGVRAREYEDALQ